LRNLYYFPEGKAIFH